MAFLNFSALLIGWAFLIIVGILGAVLLVGFVVEVYTYFRNKPAKKNDF